MKVPVYRITMIEKPETQYCYGEVIAPLANSQLWGCAYTKGSDVVWETRMELPRVYMKLKEVRKHRTKDGYKYVDEYVVHKERVTR